MREVSDDEIVIRLPDDLRHALDRFAAEHGAGEDRPHAVLSALREWALGRNYLGEAGDEGIRPEDLSAANDD
jgi:hypothetical protein